MDGIVADDRALPFQHIVRFRGVVGEYVLLAQKLGAPSSATRGANITSGSVLITWLSGPTRPSVVWSRGRPVTLRRLVDIGIPVPDAMALLSVCEYLLEPYQ